MIISIQQYLTKFEVQFMIKIIATEKHIINLITTNQNLNANIIPNDEILKAFLSSLRMREGLPPTSLPLNIVRDLLGCSQHYLQGPQAGC